MSGFGAGNLVIRFFLGSGSFPPGMTLDGATGLLSGTPTADGPIRDSERPIVIVDPANCKLGTVHRPQRRKGTRLGPLVVGSSSPVAGRVSATDEVNLRLWPKPRRADRSDQGVIK